MLQRRRVGGDLWVDVHAQVCGGLAVDAFEGVGLIGERAEDRVDVRAGGVLVLVAAAEAEPGFAVEQGAEESAGWARAACRLHHGP
ncbi:hypothetical protein ACWD4B_12520 [Streptomyces sp. NPDC002536]